MRARAVVIVALVPIAALAQVRTDSSLGRAGASIPGPNYVIPQDLGRLAGRNLFHSFATFSIGTGESATFTTSTPGLANILARVTGGEVSRIYGELRVQAADAQPAFWLINPAGVVFGQGAAVSVPGALHVTTANYIRFADGEFHADPAKASTFSSLSPEAYGFLGDSRASVSLQPGALVRSNAPVDVVAGDVSLENARLRSSSGDIRIVAAGAAPLEVPAQGAVSGARGTVSILYGGDVSTEAAGATPGGNIAVHGGTLLMDGYGVEAHTGIESSTASAAPSGSIQVDISGDVTILRGASVKTSTSGSGVAGNIRITARGITVDGAAIDDSGVLSLTEEGSTGRAGDVEVTATGALQLVNGGTISSDTTGSGNAGTVTVVADSIRLDGKNTAAFTGISSDARDLSTGDAGRVDVRANGSISIVGGSEISSTSYGSGNAGNVFVSGEDILLDATTTDYTTGIHSTSDGIAGDAGSVTVQAGSLKIVGGAEISADTYTSGRAGSVKVVARDLVVDGTGFDGFTGISSDTVDGTGSAGNVDVQGDRITLVNHGAISSDTRTSGNAGSVTVHAGTLTLAGQPNAPQETAISSRTLEGATGSAGSVTVQVDGLLSLSYGGVISSSTFSPGKAGAVSVSCDSLYIRGGNLTFATGLASQSNASATGDSGTVTLDVAHDATLFESGLIASTTYSPGRAGGVRVHVGGNLTIDGATSGLSTGIFSNSYSANSGPAGDVNVKVDGTLTVRSGGLIASDTYSPSPAGLVDVSAGVLRMDGAGSPNFTGISTNARNSTGGRAGDITVDITGDATLVGGSVIASTTLSAAPAGSIAMHAGSLTVDGSGSSTFTGLSTSSLAAQSGDAGSVSVKADDAVHLTGGGSITSSTSSADGRAGTVDIAARNVMIDGVAGTTPSEVSARATAGASGRTGNITITATDGILISEGGRVTIANASTVADASGVQPSQLDLRAPQVTIASHGAVTAESTGNVGASNVSIEASRLLTVDSASVTTSANLGNGGRISIDAGTVRLVNSQVTTSVSGTRGNGGDISVHADAVRLETGFIQANTAAPDAAGGNVAIDTRVLVASGGNVFIGGSEPIAFVPGTFGLNAIQAAAPTGVSGAIELTSPVLDTSGALAGLGAAPLDTSLVGRSPCRVAAGSSLALAGRGGLAPSARDGFRLDPPALASAGPSVPGWLAYAGGPCRAAGVAL